MQLQGNPSKIESKLVQYIYIRTVVIWYDREFNIPSHTADGQDNLAHIKISIGRAFDLLHRPLLLSPLV